MARAYSHHLRYRIAELARHGSPWLLPRRSIAAAELTVSSMEISLLPQRVR
jgi:hypothetical protein